MSEQITAEPFNFGDPDVWPTPTLQRHTKMLLMEKEVALPRKAEELDRTIGHCAFELWYRAHNEQPAETDMATAAG